MDTTTEPSESFNGVRTGKLDTLQKRLYLGLSKVRFVRNFLCWPCVCFIDCYLGSEEIKARRPHVIAN